MCNSTQNVQWWFVYLDTFVPGRYFQINELSRLLNPQFVWMWKLVPTLFVRTSEISGLSEPGLTNHHCISAFAADCVSEWHHIYRHHQHHFLYHHHVQYRRCWDRHDRRHVYVTGVGDRPRRHGYGHGQRPGGNRSNLPGQIWSFGAGVRWRR